MYIDESEAFVSFECLTPRLAEFILFGHEFVLKVHGALLLF